MQANESYFASANSGKGFVNHFGEIFSKLNKLYIIKGGSGTGKSTLMRKAAERAEKKGMTVEYFCCSSDPESLDGIIIKETAVGIIDGTAPHTADPKYPGAYDEIINLGTFWNAQNLEKHLEEIKEINEHKAELFTIAYKYLACALKMKNIHKQLSQKATDILKLNKATARMLSKLYIKVRTEAIEPEQKNSHTRNKAKPYIRHSGEEKIRLTEGITTNGRIKLDGFGNKAEIKINIRDKYEIGSLILEAARAWAKSNNLSVTISYDPLDPESLNGIYIEECNIAFCINNDLYNDAVINTERFITKDIYRNSRNLIRYCDKCRKELENGAYDLLSQVKKEHFKLEKIYVSSMDFDSKTKFEEEFIEKIV